MFLSWVSKVDNRGAVGAEGVGCGEVVSPSPPGEGFGEAWSVTLKQRTHQTKKAITERTGRIGQYLWLSRIILDHWQLNWYIKASGPFALPVLMTGWAGSFNGFVVDEKKADKLFCPSTCLSLFFGGPLLFPTFRSALKAVLPLNVRLITIKSHNCNKNHNITPDDRKYSDETVKNKLCMKP